MWSWGNCLLLGVFYASFSLHNEKHFFFLPLGLTHPSFKVCALCTSEHFCSFVCWIGPFVRCGMWEVKRGWVEKFYLLFWHNTAITWLSVRSGWTLVCVICISSGRASTLQPKKAKPLKRSGEHTVVGETWMRFVRPQAYFTWHFNNYVPMHIHLTTGTQWNAMPKIIPWTVRCLFYLSSCRYNSFLSLTLHSFSIDMQFLDIKALACKTFRCWWKGNAAIMHDLNSYDRIVSFCPSVARWFYDVYF